MLTPIDRKKVYKAAVEQIKDQIESGKWPMGTKLPSERELAEQLGIGRPSIREALRVLEVMGLIKIVIGQGTFVKEISTREKHIQVLQSMLREDEYVVELLELREMLEPQIALMAAQSVTEEDIKRLEDILDRMENDLNEGNTGVDENIEFHLTLTRAVGNRVLLQTHEFLLRNSRDSLERFFHIPGRLKESLKGHREILKAIKDRNPKEAQRRMLAHLRKRYTVPDQSQAEKLQNPTEELTPSHHKNRQPSSA
ncbi:MAG: FadR/GntR family transcriptional regulator [Spirochaetota bacterium]